MKMEFALCIQEWFKSNQVQVIFETSILWLVPAEIFIRLSGAEAKVAGADEQHLTQLLQEHTKWPHRPRCLRGDAIHTGVFSHGRYRRHTEKKRQQFNMIQPDFNNENWENTGKIDKNS
jgi:hypothetical protein